MKARQSEILFSHLGKNVFSVELENDCGMKVCISNYGAIIQSVIFPDRYNNFIDVVLGFDHIGDYLSEDYLAHYPYFGAVIGRYANRIQNAAFHIGEKEFIVSKNIPPHQLHGGFSGFDKQVWEVQSVSLTPLPRVELSYLSRDGEEGFPGNLQVKLTYELNNSNELCIRMEAHTDQPTAVNLCNHSYFNLNGNGGSVAKHLLQIPADYYLEQDTDYVVTGRLLAVKNSAHDFLEPKPIGGNWNADQGYDQFFVLNKPPGDLGLAAMAYSAQTGIKLEVFSNQAGVQFYTAKHLYINQGKKGMNYRPFSAFCLETQQHPNSVNIREFPHTILKPGETYLNYTAFKFSADQ